MSHEKQEQRTRQIPGLSPEESEDRMQTGQSDDISEAITVSEKHLDDQPDPVKPEKPAPSDNPPGDSSPRTDKTVF